MPHAPANPLDVLSVETIFSTSGGAQSIKYPIAANGTVALKGTIKPGIYGVMYQSSADPTESIMGKFAVMQTAAGTFFTDLLETPAIAGPGALTAVFDVGGDAAAATEVNVSVTTPGIVTIKTGSSVLAGSVTIWKEVNFPGV